MLLDGGRLVVAGAGILAEPAPESEPVCSGAGVIRGNSARVLLMHMVLLGLGMLIVAMIT